MPERILAEELNELIGTDRCPHIVDVRRWPIFEAAEKRIACAVWRDHMKTDEWLPQFVDPRPIVVYCAHGHNVSELAAARLAAAGADVLVLDGGMDAFEAAGGTTVNNKAAAMESGLPLPSVWVTRERPKIDRIACPWLVRRFADPHAVFHFVAAEWVKDVAGELGAIPFDIGDVHYSHRGDECTFDTMIHEFGIEHPALLRLAGIVRGADTARFDLEPQAAGLLAVSLGLSAIEEDDLRQLERGMVIYDALYGWCRHAADERHNWLGSA